MFLPDSEIISFLFLTSTPIKAGLCFILFQIEQVSPGFSERYLLQTEQFSHELEQYHKYIKSMISIADKDGDAEQFADDIVAFSKQLAKVSTPLNFDP